MLTGEERTKVMDQVMRASARVMAKEAIGSSTIIYSRKDPDATNSNWETFLLTNHHVVEKNIIYKEVWDNIVQKDVKKSFTDTVELHFNRLDDRGSFVSSTNIVADIVTYNVQQDIALLRVRDKIEYYPAFLFPYNEADSVPMLVPLCCCGAALGHKPIVTFGNLNGVQIEIDNFEYWMSSAPSIFGNSGGGVFTNLHDRWEFLGIPSRISVVPLGYGGSAVTHMGYFIPAPRIYKWLESECYQYLYDDSFTKAKCDELREEKKREQLAMFMQKKTN